MTTVRQRAWLTQGGKRRAWVVEYIDPLGVRRLRTFRRNKAAAELFAKQQSYRDERDTGAEKLVVQTFIRRRLAAFKNTPLYEVERARLITEMMEWAESTAEPSTRGRHSNGAIAR